MITDALLTFSAWLGSWWWLLLLGVATVALLLAVAGKLRVCPLTRHLPLATALAAITTELVVERLRQLHDGMRALGFEQPRLALAGLNPHAGEAGLLGSEENEILEPAAVSGAVRFEGNGNDPAHRPITDDQRPVILLGKLLMLPTPT